MSRTALRDPIRGVMARMPSTIVRAYRDALAEGIGDPAVNVLDSRDGDARATGCVLQPEAVIARSVFETGRRGKVPRWIVGLSREDLVGLLAAFRAIDPSRPEVAKPPEGYLLAVLAPGETALVAMPLPD